MSDIGQEDFTVTFAGGKYAATRLVGGGIRWFRLGEPWDAATNDWQYAGAINALIDELHAARCQQQSVLAAAREASGIDNTVRKAHYGDGEQPWDVIVRLGWGPAFAAGNVLKYLRRSKHQEHSMEIAAWYYARLVEGCAQEPQMGASTRRYKWVPMKPWSAALYNLENELTQEERARVRAATQGTGQ